MQADVCQVHSVCELSHDVNWKDGCVQLKSLLYFVMWIMGHTEEHTSYHNLTSLGNSVSLYVPHSFDNNWCVLLSMRIKNAARIISAKNVVFLIISLLTLTRCTGAQVNLARGNFYHLDIHLYNTKLQFTPSSPISKTNLLNRQLAIRLVPAFTTKLHISLWPGYFYFRIHTFNFK
jgi:hypothetical protein